MSAVQSLNVAAVLETSKAPQLTITTLPIPQPGPNEVLVRNHAVAANPVDFKIQDYGVFITKYPNVIGSDVAGVVEAVGPDVTKFKVGDRVAGFAAVVYNQEITHGAWQTYTVLRTLATTRLPSSNSFVEGSTIPMGFATAAVGLYMDLKLPLPSIALQPKPKSSEAILIWGGASSVGSFAIQLAKNSGLKVFTTASKKHEENLKSQGADEVFDYHDPNVVEKIVEAAKQAGTQIKYGFDAITEGDTAKLAANVLAISGGEGKLVITLGWPDVYEKPTGIEILSTGAYRLFTERPDLGVWFFNEYLPGALENRSVVPAPPAEIVDGGIAATQQVLNLLRKGVSGKKLVVKVE